MDKTLIDYDKNLEELERQREKLEIVMQRMGQEWEESGAGIGWLGQLDPAVNASVGSPTSPKASASTVTRETRANTETAESDELVPGSKNEKTANSNTTTPTSAVLSPSANVLKTFTTNDITSIIPTVAEMIPETSQSLSSVTERPLFSNMLSAEAGPSPEYLQSLLNVNEALLAQSLADNNEHPTTPILSPTNDMVNSYGDSTTTSSMMAVHPEHVQFDASRARIRSPLITPTKEDDTTPNDESVNNTPLDYVGSINLVTEKVLSPLAAHDKSFAHLTDATSAKPTTRKRHSYHYR